MTSDYAGLYSWRSADEADAYAQYITALIAPFSTPGSVGYHVYEDETLDAFLAS